MLASDFNGAVIALQNAVKIRQRTQGLSHRDTLSAMSALGVAHDKADRDEEAIALHERTQRLKRTHVGSDDEDTLSSMHDLASAYLSADRLEEAIELSQKTTALMRNKLGSNHTATLSAMSLTASTLRQMGRSHDASVILDEVVNIKRQKLKLPFDRGLYESVVNDALSSMLDLAKAFEDSQQADDAEAILLERLTMCRSPISTPLLLAEALTEYGNCLAKHRNFSDAESILIESYDVLKSTPVASSGSDRAALLAKTVRSIVALYSAWGKSDKSNEWQKRADELNE